MFVITVPSDNGDKVYTVRKAGNLWVCDCKDHVFRSHGKSYTCKHIADIATSLFQHVLGSARSAAADEILEDDGTTAVA